jgi:hypothetical protein
MADAHDIAIALGGERAQRLAGGGWLVPCPVPSHGKGRGDRLPSLRIGDGASQLLVCCYAGCDPRDVLDELRRRGLLDDRQRASRKPVVVKAPSRDDDHARKQHDKAAWLWSLRKPISGSIAEVYLREARKIAGPLPPTLGFLPPRKPEQHPAMIAAFGLCDEPDPGMLAAPRDVQAIHLTLLKRDGSGKADVDAPKLMVGSPGSLPIVLAPPNDLLGLAITEGLEDALTAHDATGLGAWAAGSAGRMPALGNLIPDYMEALTIFAHADKAGQDGARALAEQLDEHGIEVFIEGLP